MRIALISQEYPPETAKGGLGVQTWIKAHGLNALGHEIHVISRSPHGGCRSERQDHGITVTRIPGWESRLGVFTELADWLTYSAEVAHAVAALHARSPLDLVDFPEWGAEGYVYFSNRTPWNHIPSVVHLHGPLVMFAHTMNWPELGSEFYRTGTHMEGTCLRLADAVFSSSLCSAEWCAKYYELDRGSIPVIHTGVDTELFAPGNAPKAANPTIVFAGKLTSNKGVHLLVEAACRLAREFSGLRLELIGRAEPGVIQELEQAARSAGAPELLHTPGAVSQGQLPEYFSRAHVFAAPSRYEGGPGFVYLEAMACALPVIACGGSGAAEVVRHGQTGLLIPPQDIDALTSALRGLLEDPAMCRRMGEHGRRFVLTEADSRACIKRLEAFYESIATKNNLRRPRGRREQLDTQCAA
jgi:glycogen synthase